jgi:hypothetical protein
VGCLFGHRPKGGKHISASNGALATGCKAPGWYGKKLYYRLIAVLAFVAIQSILFACASNTPTVAGKADVEAWELELTGQTVGKLKMTLKRYNIEEDSHSFTGKLTGPIKDHRGGMGNADYKLKGKIIKGVFTTRIGGYSNMTAGPSTVSGNMKGRIIGSQGSGIWRVLHALGTSTGEFTMKKIESSQ